MPLKETTQMIDKNYLQQCQADVKIRFKGYKQGRQQGLGIVWDNMLKELKKRYLAAKKIENNVWQSKR